jgi:hypothetical protein
MIQKAAYDELCHDALRVMNATNLVFPNEKMALKDDWVDRDAQSASQKLFVYFLSSRRHVRMHSCRLPTCWKALSAAKWTTATYYTYFVFPEHQIFVKPTVTQNAAELSAFDINYKPDLNWLTYRRGASSLRCVYGNDLADLKPRDMIDVQSFMWCISPDI